MYSSISRWSRSLIPRLTRCQAQLTASRTLSIPRMPPGFQQSFQQDVNSSENVAPRRTVDNASAFSERNSSSESVAPRRTLDNVFGSSSENVAPGRTLDNAFAFSERNSFSENAAPRRTLDNLFGSSSGSVAPGSTLNNAFAFSERNSRPMNFVKGGIDQDRQGSRAGFNMEHNADVVHIKLMRNNTFVTVTDSKGNKKLGASAGSVPEMKGGAKLSKYAAEATAEHVGRMSRNFGLKSVVMRVKGFTYFKKKKQAILSWKDGFTNSRVDQNPVVYIEDTTRKPHNGCRLRKKRRV